VSASGKPKVGDTVRLAIEGEVNYVENAGFSVRTDANVGNGLWIRYDDGIVKNIEVTKRPRKVGELVDRDEIMLWEPNAGTLIQQIDRIVEPICWMKTMSTGRWVNSDGVFAMPSALPRGKFEIKVIT
jgi:hypothetical protein